MEDGPQSERETLKDDLRNVFEEARMVLPGIQALIGFQTMAVFNQRFSTMPDEVKSAYLVALGLLILGMGLLMTPAAYHRLAERGMVSLRMINLTSTLITDGMVPLMLAFAIDVYVVAVAALGNSTVGIYGAVGTVVFLTGLWFVFPLAKKRRAPRWSYKARCEISERRVSASPSSWPPSEIPTDTISISSNCRMREIIDRKVVLSSL